MSSKGPVIIMELPEQLKQGEVKTFMRELQPLLDSPRPCVVLDRILNELESGNAGSVEG